MKFYTILECKKRNKIVLSIPLPPPLNPQRVQALYAIYFLSQKDYLTFFHVDFVPLTMFYPGLMNNPGLKVHAV